MEPTLIDGDRLLIVPVRVDRVEPGMILAARDPEYRKRLLVKRCESIDRCGRLSLSGDNVEFSTDSRHFGTVPASAILGRAVYRYAPPERAGRL